MNFKLDHVAITTRNVEETLDFYKALGFEEVERFSKDATKIVNIKYGDLAIDVCSFAEIIDTEKEDNVLDEIRKTQINHIGFKVEDMYKFAEFLKDKLDIDLKINEGSFVKYYAFIKDPNGVVLEFVEKRK